MATLEEAGMAWLALNDPAHAAVLHGFSETSDRYASLVAADPGQPKLTSAAVLLCDDPNAVFAESRKLREMLGTPEGLQLFKDDPLDGCTSVMGLAMKSSGYNPDSPGLTSSDERVRNAAQAQNVAAYNQYVSKLVSTPFFFSEINDTKQLHSESQDYTKLIEQITDLFEGSLKEDNVSIRKTLVTLANNALSHPGQTQSGVFMLSVLEKRQNISASIYSSRAEMRSDTNQSATTTQTDCVIQRTRLRFQAGQWPKMAERVWGMQVTTVDDWLASNTTPTVQQVG